jgi:hypothetical protein
LTALDDLDGPAKLRKALEAQGRDLAWLRRAIGTGAGTVYHWAAGSRTPGPKYALLIQGALGLDARTWDVRSVKRERAPRERKAKPERCLKLRERTGGNAKWKMLGDYDRAMPDRGAR